MPKDPSDDYEKKLSKLIKAYSKRIQEIYYNSIIEITSFAAARAGQTAFQTELLTTSVIDLFPALKIKLNDIAEGMHNEIYKETINAIRDAWELSNKKNDEIADEVLSEVEIAGKVKELVYNPNEDALKAFIKRKDKGLNLSAKVWKMVNPYKFELEAGLQDGISKGKSAASMATDLKRNLNEPDRLFRRVRDKNGKLQLSRAAKAYHPGQGQYRSSFKNSLRLTATETNISYKSSDHERWKNQDFVKGIEIKLSNNNPKCDLCKSMVGLYPKDFKFLPWHPFCRCIAIPVLVGDEEFDAQQDYYLGLTDKLPKVDEIKEIPVKAKEWVTKNAKMIKGLKNKPYWQEDNSRYINPLLKTKKK